MMHESSKSVNYSETFYTFNYTITKWITQQIVSSERGRKRSSMRLVDEYVYPLISYAMRALPLGGVGIPAV